MFTFCKCPYTLYMGTQYKIELELKGSLKSKTFTLTSRILVTLLSNGIGNFRDSLARCKCRNINNGRVQKYCAMIGF